MTPAQVIEAAEIVRQHQSAKDAIRRIDTASRWLVEADDARLAYLPRQYLRGAYVQFVEDCAATLARQGVTVDGHAN